MLPTEMKNVFELMHKSFIFFSFLQYVIERPRPLGNCILYVLAIYRVVVLKALILIN